MDLELIIYIIIAHIIGDYFLQPALMAYYKKEKSTRGIGAAMLHCFIYSLVSMIIISIGCDEVYKTSQRLIIFSLIFLSHYIIDRPLYLIWFSSAILGRHLPLIKKMQPTPENVNITAIDAVVYIVMDNFIHIVGNYWIVLLVL